MDQEIAQTYDIIAEPYTKNYTIIRNRLYFTRGNFLRVALCIDKIENKYKLTGHINFIREHYYHMIFTNLDELIQWTAVEIQRNIYCG